MIAYSIAIFVCMVIIAGLNIIFNNIITWHYAIIATIVFTLFAFLIDLIISAIVIALPKKIFNPQSKIFKIFKWERHFYEKIGIKKWKDYLPIGAGPIGIGFKKDKVLEPDNPEYIYKFLEESCIAELMHLVSAIAGFLLLIIAPSHTLMQIVFPVCIVNFLLQALPFFTQRYNRPKLMVLHRRAVKYSNTTQPEPLDKPQPTKQTEK